MGFPLGGGKPTDEKVSLPSDRIGLETGIPAEMGDGPPSIALALSVVLVNLPTDQESPTSSDTHNSMPGLSIERESPNWSIFDDTDDDFSGRKNNIMDESKSMEFS